jgi:uncharacterized repeat protein (TIGR03803 family)
VKNLGSSCYALALGALLAGCGSQPIGAPGATPQTSARAIVHHVGVAATYQQLYRFHPQNDGTHPSAALLDFNGTLYGTTTTGGSKGNGTVFSVSTSGAHTVLYRFRGIPDGRDPQSGLLDVGGTFYGTTAYGGSAGAGTVYTMSTSGAEKVLYSFSGGSDGADPQAGLIDVDGTLYGTTKFGGGGGCSSSGQSGCGTVFSISTSGQEKALYSFAGGSDGAFPEAELIDVKGVLYGTTLSGGSYGGTVYRITPEGAEKVLHVFQGGSDGDAPLSGLIDVKGMLYGTTFDGGANRCSGDGCGTVYRISTTGAEKVLYSFAGSDGESPQGGLINVNGTLYGTTAFGGVRCFSNVYCGTVYSITTAGAETVLYDFAAGADGWWPAASLTNVNGTLYGTTYRGGDRDKCCHIYGWGTAFSISP